MIEIRRSESGSETVLSVRGTLVRATCEAFEGMVKQLTFTGTREVVLDLTGVRRIDTFGRKAIQHACLTLQQSGRRLLMLRDGLECQLGLI